MLRKELWQFECHENRTTIIHIFLQRIAKSFIYNQFMNENTIVVYHGFLNLSMKEKKQLVDAMNEYFDSMNREPIREAAEKQFVQIDLEKTKCKCCGR